ncbi:hypothetical protein OPT61_g10171 [Boeremia exigua]|uniref:Uncharacterized protein n=1 Tax=Boeremia exigua TaxID=749465 RepID=A0ACC2HQX1_9PLEO|nr:hypothetical protein OPT61_g10171 [Boeremia exigua]
MTDCARSRRRRTATRSTSAACPRATTPSTPPRTASLVQRARHRLRARVGGPAGSAGEGGAPAVGARLAGQGRAGLHRCPREDTQEHGREHQRARQVVEHLPAPGAQRERRLPGLVVEEVLRGEARCMRGRSGDGLR